MNSVTVADGLESVRKLPDRSIHLILSDIPYGIGVADWDVLHNNTNSALLGASPAQVKAGDVFRSRGKPLNGWSRADRQIPQEYQQWCGKFARDWFRVLKPGASAMVFAGRRLSHRCIVALEDAGFTLKDTLAWIRPSAPYRAQRLSVVFQRRGDIRNADNWEGWRVGNLRPTFEPVLWFVKPYKIGSTIADNVIQHEVGAFCQDEFVRFEHAPDNVLRSGFGINESGHHVAQKPIRLLQALISLTTIGDQVVLDPFCGSGSTLVAAKAVGRKYIGFDVDEEAVAIALERLAPDLFDYVGGR
ncbi:MAG: site-specific DNA-methyltransferase [Chloroflexota bacterium]|nr:site-specific DNA-methyltransferase [Chloroflexota bacterium]MDE2898889.1 site-specific DNA-methyltransferase [Chloroflexota bacterium]